MSVPPQPYGIEDQAKPTFYDQALEPQLEIPLKSGTKSDQDTLNVTFSGAIRAPSPDPSLVSIDDSNNIRLGRNPDYLSVPDGRRHGSLSPAARPRTLKGKLKVFWYANKGLALVLISQVFGTLMNITTRMLEVEGNNGMSHLNLKIRGSKKILGKGYHPFQVHLKPSVHHSPPD